MQMNCTKENEAALILEATCPSNRVLTRGVGATILLASPNPQPVATQLTPDVLMVAISVGIPLFDRRVIDV